MRIPRSSSLSVLGLLALAGSAAFAQGCKAGTVGENTSVNASALRRVQTCGELDLAMKSSAREKLNRAVDAQIDGIKRYGWQTYYYAPTYGEDAAGTKSSGAAGGSTSSSSGSVPAPSGGASNSSGGGSATAPVSTGAASDSTKTNNQVEGVSEADIVQTDQDKFIYTLHGKALKVIDVWPATSMREAASLDIEGSPLEVIVNNGQAVVFSRVDGTPIYKAAGVSPNDRDTSDPWGNPGTASGSTSGSPKTTPSVGSSSGGSSGSSGSSTPTDYEPYRAITKASVLRFDGTRLSVVAEYWFEGTYLSSRRVDAYVRAALNGYDDTLDALTWPSWGYYGSGDSAPKNAGDAIAALEAMRAKGLARIDASDVVARLPRSFVKAGAKITVDAETCSNYFVPNGASTSGITRIASFDMAGAVHPQTTSIVAEAQTIYASRDSFYVAAQSWNRDAEWAASWGANGGGSATVGVSGGSVPVPVDAPAPSGSSGSPKPASAHLTDATPAPERPFFDLASTRVHKFQFAGVEPLYQGSGEVPGTIVDQFAMDDLDGALRIATTSQRTNGVKSEEDNHVYVLQQTGGALAKVGDSGSLVKDENIHSVRFLGTKGYVVTYRHIDPLFALDLSDPKNPHVTGQLEIPGFSSYIHPMDATHLLTIGRATIDMGDRVLRGALKLEIFDVADSTHPKSVQKWVDDKSRYGSSDAESEHRAFTYFTGRELLAFPYTSYSDAGYVSNVELFRVSPSGITQLGNLDWSALPAQSSPSSCNNYGYEQGFRRAAFFASGATTYAYGVSLRGVLAKNVDALGAAPSALGLPAPAFDPYESYGYGYGYPESSPSCSQTTPVPTRGQ